MTRGVLPLPALISQLWRLTQGLTGGSGGYSHLAACAERGCLRASLSPSWAEMRKVQPLPPLLAPAFRTASDGLFWKSSLCGVTKGTVKGGELSRVGTTNTIPYGENATSVHSPSRSVLNFTLRLFKLAIYVNKQARKHPHRDRLCWPPCDVMANGEEPELLFSLECFGRLIVRGCQESRMKNRHLHMDIICNLKKWRGAFCQA